MNQQRSVGCNSFRAEFKPVCLQSPRELLQQSTSRLFVDDSNCHSSDDQMSLFARRTSGRQLLLLQQLIISIIKIQRLHQTTHCVTSHGFTQCHVRHTEALCARYDKALVQKPVMTYNVLLTRLATSRQKQRVTVY